MGWLDLVVVDSDSRSRDTSGHRSVHRLPGWWQTLVYSTGALVSLLMLFIIQHTTNRDTNAVLLKLDELISAIPAAHEEAIDIEDREIYEQEEVHHRLHHEAGQDSHDDTAQVHD